MSDPAYLVSVSPCKGWQYVTIERMLPVLGDVFGDVCGLRTIGILFGFAASAYL